MKSLKCKKRKCHLLLEYAGKEKCLWAGWAKLLKDLKTCPLDNPNRNKDNDFPFEG